MSRLPKVNHLPILIKNMFSSQPVLCIAVIATIITCIFVPIDRQYLDYINYRTLATLFCTLAVVNAFSHIHLFEIISKTIVLKFHNLRNVTLGLVFITFVGSMVLANDMALLTFLPLGFFVLNRTGNHKAMAYTFILQNIAANLGGMVTPFGNPQNLYLYSYYHIDNWDFICIMLPTFLASMVIIMLLCLIVKPVPLQLNDEKDYTLNIPLTITYCILFIASILVVMRVIPFILGTIVITLILICIDYHAILKVNYGLLATFLVFFIFSGNMSRIPLVASFFRTLLPQNTLLFGIISCQCISNVPSAVLLSAFTSNYEALLPAVNIGGLGTLIASLASLITYTEFKKHQPTQIKHYIILFSIMNFSLALILFVLESFMLYL